MERRLPRQKATTTVHDAQTTRVAIYHLRRDFSVLPPSVSELPKALCARKYPPNRNTWKAQRQTTQTAAVPPNAGSKVRPTIGCMPKIRNEPRKIVIAARVFFMSVILNKDKARPLVRTGLCIEL